MRGWLGIVCTVTGLSAGHATTLALDSLIGTQTIATVLLDANKPVKVCDITQPTACWTFLHPGMAGGDRMLFAMSLINAMDVTLRNGTPTTCNDPCEIDARLNWGDAYAISEETNGSGVSFSPKKLFGVIRVPTVVGASLAAGAWKLPVEVIGEDNYTTYVQFAVPAGAPTTGLLMYLRISNHSYSAMTTYSQAGGLHAPWDGKASFQVCSSTALSSCGAWININNTNVTGIDELRWSAIDGVHPIASASNTVEVTLPVPDGSIATNATGMVGFRFNGSDGITSGYRVLDFALLDNSTNEQLASIVVSGGVPTLHTTSGTTVAATGDDWLVYGAPGMRGRFNGRRHVTSSTPGSGLIVTTVCGSGAGFYMVACSVPDGTYTVPTSTANATLIASYPGAAQPQMFAVRIVAPLTSALVYDDPTGYTAPGGGNATTGHTLFTARNSLLNSNAASLGYKLSVACSDCHAGNATLIGGMKDEGSDLKYFNYSNYAIEQRCLFHGLTFQNCLDITAYIRGITSITTYANARPFNPPFQPGPGLDANPVAQWPAGCGVDCVATYDADMKEYLTPAGSFATWAWNSHIDWRETPIPYQLQDWTHWLPAVHPQDAFPTLATRFFNSTPYTDYTNLVTAVKDNTVGEYTAQAANFGQMKTDFELWGNGTIGATAGITRCGGFASANTAIGSCNAPSPADVYQYSIYQLFMVKGMFELMHPNLEGMCANYYTAVYGARPSGSYDGRCWFKGRPLFDEGAHIVLLSPHNVGAADAALYPKFAQSPETSSWLGQTNQWYTLAMINNFGNYHMSINDVVDEGYYPNFQHAMANYRPAFWMNKLPLILYNQTAQDTSFPSRSAAGTCNTVTTSVTAVTGTFGSMQTAINIAGVSYTFTFIDSTHGTLGASAGTQSGVNWYVPGPNVLQTPSTVQFLLFEYPYQDLSQFGPSEWSFASSSDITNALDWYINALTTAGTNCACYGTFNGVTDATSSWSDFHSAGFSFINASGNISSGIGMLLAIGAHFGVNNTDLTNLANWANGLQVGKNGAGSTNGSIKHDFTTDISATCTTGANGWINTCTNF